MNYETEQILYKTRALDYDRMANKHFTIYSKIRNRYERLVSPVYVCKMKFWEDESEWKRVEGITRKMTDAAHHHLVEHDSLRDTARALWSKVEG